MPTLTKLRGFLVVKSISSETKYACVLKYQS